MYSRKKKWSVAFDKQNIWETFEVQIASNNLVIAEMGRS